MLQANWTFSVLRKRKLKDRSSLLREKLVQAKIVSSKSKTSKGTMPVSGGRMKPKASERGPYGGIVCQS